MRSEYTTVENIIEMISNGENSCVKFKSEQTKAKELGE